MERNRIKKYNSGPSPRRSELWPREGGQAMITSVVFFLFISLTTIAGLISPTVRGFSVSRVDLESKSAYYLTESGIEDVLYRFKSHMTLGTSEVITLGSNTVTTRIPGIISAQEPFDIVALGDVNSYQRQVTAQVNWTLDVPFYYGVQVGLGGVDLSSSSIIGNVYANGPITGDSSSSITGTAISASSAALFIDQQNGAGAPFYDRNFGNANNSQDVAQGFMLDNSAPVSKAFLYIKKVSSPGDLTVKIVNNSAGVPGTTVYASGTLSASSVSTAYSWVEVSFSSNPTLSTATPYWLVIDSPTTNASRYYVAGASDDAVASYSGGMGLTGQFNGSWANIYPTSYDHFFKIYLGGLNGIIAGSSGSQWNPLHVGTTSGTAQANTVNYTNSTGLIYCQSGTGNNKSCTSQADPQYLDYPISDATISGWKTTAETAGVISGNYNLPSGSATIGPTKITGNLTVGGGAILTVAGTLWVVGNISLTGGSQIRLASSYGSADGVIISDGNITIGGGSDATGSGDPDSYIMIMTTSSSGSAVSLSGGSGAVILYAPNGTMNISGGADIQEATANRLVISGNSVVTYNSGLQNASFSSGATTSVPILNMSYWKETE
ncbi:MAG: hypothetical protein KBC12_03120 [Candidatus Pacebacteria bacterium]|nr:hypothetical protein [Candidatus Paceibacterota bacterium]